MSRLGLENANFPHSHRYGLVYFERAALSVESGTVMARTAGFEGVNPGTYQIPFQSVSILALGPGTSVTNDVVRICALNGTAIEFIGHDFLRHYASMPFGKSLSQYARSQVAKWSTLKKRNQVALNMYSRRFGEPTSPEVSIETLRGMEGARTKSVYSRLAQEYGVPWQMRRYSRKSPESNDPANQAINYASSFLRSAASLAVSATSTIPQLGFIHEHSDISFVLDIADLFREECCVRPAFKGLRSHFSHTGSIEKCVRLEVAAVLKRDKVIDQMIEDIEKLLR